MNIRQKKMFLKKKLKVMTTLGSPRQQLTRGLNSIASFIIKKKGSSCCTVALHNPSVQLTYQRWPQWTLCYASFFFLFLFLTVKNSFRSWTWSMIWKPNTRDPKCLQRIAKDSHQHNSTWQALLMSSFKIIENYFFFRFRWRFNLENHILRRV